MTPCECPTCRVSRAMRDLEAAHDGWLNQSADESMELAYLHSELVDLVDRPWWKRLRPIPELRQMLHVIDPTTTRRSPQSAPAQRVDVASAAPARVEMTLPDGSSKTITRVPLREVFQIFDPPPTPAGEVENNHE